MSPENGITRHLSKPEVFRTLRLVSDSADALRAAALAGLGIAHLPRVLVAEDLSSGRLRTVLADHAPRPLPVHVLYPDRRHLLARVRLLIDLFSNRLAVLR